MVAKKKDIGWGGRESDNSSGEKSDGREDTESQSSGAASDDGLFDTQEEGNAPETLSDSRIKLEPYSADEGGLFGNDDGGGSVLIDKKNAGLGRGAEVSGLDIAGKSSGQFGASEKEDVVVSPDHDIDLSSMPDLEKDRLYVFMFGKPQAGKSVILSGLLRFLETDDSVTFDVDLRDMDQASTNKLHELKSSIKERRFVSGTDALKQDSSVWELKGTITPSNPSKRLPPLKVAFLELAGEDLRKIIVGDRSYAGNFDPRILHYLTSWENVDNMCFFMVAPADEAGEHEDALTGMFQYMSSKDMREAPTIVMLSKWDKLGSSAQEKGKLRNIIKTEMPSTWQQIRDMKRDVATMRFSIGKELEDGKITYDSADSKNLARRLYVIGTGLKRDPWDVEESGGWFSRIFARIFGK